MEQESKTCNDCGETKSLSSFHRDNTKRDGRRGSCILCIKQRTKSKQNVKSYNNKELFCKKSIESKFPGYVFEKVRLGNFINPETGRALELDLYCRELNMALEYNGRQHYEYVEFFHSQMEEFEKQKVRDLIKEGYCDIFGINLIEIPNLQTYEEIDDYITKALEAKNIQPIKSEKLQRDSTAFMKLHGELLQITNEVVIIGVAIKSKVYGRVDISDELDNIRSQYNKKFDELKNEYTRLLSI